MSHRPLPFSLFLGQEINGRSPPHLREERRGKGKKGRKREREEGLPFPAFSLLSSADIFMGNVEMAKASTLYHGEMGKAG